MSNVLINNLPVLEARLQVPRCGNWTADVIVDSVTASQIGLGSAAKLELAGGALPFQGTVYRVDTYADTVSLRLVGGSNGLAKECKPRFYSNVQVSVPLADILSDTGSKRSDTSDAVALAAELPFWALIQQPAAEALTLLADSATDGAVWRVLADGTVFFGVDGFAPSDLEDYELIDYLPQDGMQVIAAEVPNVSPGQSFAGRKVSAVEHRINAQDSRARLWFE